jgi:hypothetical protein
LVAEVCSCLLHRSFAIGPQRPGLAPSDRALRDGGCRDSGF